MPELSHAGIIAAGEGRRLRGGAPQGVKALARAGGRPLCHWVTRSLQAAGARELTLLRNSRGGAVEASLLQEFPQARWTFLRADTASSWESFRLVAQALAARAPAFLISAVDSLIPPAQARGFSAAMAASRAEAGLALTDFIDDEKPLWATLSEARVTALGPACRDRRLATAGLYYLTAEAARAMPEAGRFPSLRGYLAWLVESGRTVAGFCVDKTLDVDRPQDLEQAESFLKEARFS